MTSEHTIITEEVQKDGELQTITRETLQTTVETPEDRKSQQAYGVTHPGYISAQDRTYTYDEELGMSRSELAPVAESETDDLPEDEEVTEEEDPGDEPSNFMFATPEPELCGKPVGSGTCVLDAGHSGSHRLTL